MAKATTVRFTDEMAARLDQASAQTGMPVNSIVIAACLEWMARHVEQLQLVSGGQAGTPVGHAVPRWATLRRALKRMPRSASTAYPFERFTAAAQEMLTRAQGEATRAGLSYIGTEHLLLAAFGDPKSDAARVLASLNVTEEHARTALTRLLGRKKTPPLHRIVPTSRVKAVIELAFKLCGVRGDSPRVSTGHLLLALSLEAEGIAAHVMNDAGATRERIEGELDQLAEREA